MKQKGSKNIPVKHQEERETQAEATPTFTPKISNSRKNKKNQRGLFLVYIVTQQPPKHKRIKPQRTLQGCQSSLLNGENQRETAAVEAGPTFPVQRDL